MNIPMIAGAAVLILGMLGTAGYTAKTWWDAHIVEQQNIGARQCQGAVKAAEFNKLNSDYTKLVELMGKEQERAAEARREAEQLKRASAEAHVAIAAELDAARRQAAASGKGGACAIPNRAIDIVNKPIN